MQKIIIVGNGIAAKILYGYIKNDKRYKVIAFSVDYKYINQSKLFGLDVVDLNKLKDLYSVNGYKLILGVGYNNINKDREDIFKRVKNFGYRVETYIHLDARIYNENCIGEGSIIFANSVVEPYSTIGKNSVIWANCTIAHHSSIEDNCWIASGSVIAGEAKIKSNCFLGVNSTVVNKVVVDKFNIIGAHAMVSKNTKENEVYLARSGEKHRFGASDYVHYFGI
jgi:sugar O-acyltransferase (sialic acid O-acetyltransferase NeuD family)